MLRSESCAIEVFEKSTSATALLECEAVCGSHLDGVSGMPPTGLWWLLSLLRYYDASVLVPDDVATEPIEHLVRTFCRGSVMKLSAKSAFDSEATVSRLHHMYPDTPEAEWSLRLNWSHRSMLAALSALLQFTSSAASNVMDVKETSGPGMLYVEEHTSDFLQLTRCEPHPVDFQGTGRSKEGLSLFSVLNHTMSAAGKAKLQQWFCFPCATPEALNERLDVVQLFAAPGCQEALHHARLALRRVSPTERILQFMRSGKAGFAHYRRLLETIEQYLRLYALLLPMASTCAFIQRVVGSITTQPLQRMAAIIRTVVVGCGDGGRRGADNAAGTGLRVPPSSSSSVRELQIQRGADPTGLLDELRSRYRELHLSLEQKGREALWRMPPELQRHVDLQCVFLPSPHGYLLSLPKDQLLDMVPQQSQPLATDEEALECISREYGWQLHHYDGDQLSAEAAPPENDGEEVHLLYFKSPEMLEMDGLVGDLQARIRSRELEVKQELDRLLILHSLYLIPPAELLAELDCLLGFAYVSLTSGWSRPVLLDGADGVLRIANGWHPVLGCALGRHNLIPFSLSVDPTHHICLVLGVNSSGKSILLGAVAVIAFMAQLGCFVPADRVEMTLLSRIFAASPIPIEGTSSFYAECTALGRTLSSLEATHPCHPAENCSCCYPSLVIVDELGKGTAPEDGRALLSSSLRYFAGVMGPSCATDAPLTDRSGSQRQRRRLPIIVLCATHFVEILDHTRDLHLHQVAPSAAFPFELVQIYEMKSTLAHHESNHPSREPPFTSTLSEVDSDNMMSVRGLGQAVDVIPTFTPLCVTPRAGYHEDDYYAYRLANTVRGAPSLGRRCGLPPWLQNCWEKALMIVTNPDAGPLQLRPSASKASLPRNALG